MCTNGTPLIQALEEVGGTIQKEHLVSSFAPLFNIPNVIKIRLIFPKICIQPNGNARRIYGQTNGSQDFPFSVEDLYATTLEEDNTEVVLEYLRMC